jgi:hypothetical protein
MPEPASEQSIFLNALALPTAAERAAYLDEACRNNAGLRADLDALLAAHERLGGVLLPPIGIKLRRHWSSKKREVLPQSLVNNNQ